ncbi:MAG: helical backbone metal receptor [Bacteroidales bacterium]|jgi:iron complex transport system substrate-binding protein|nr:helical backbone metal receptor [Bacteroidales bacterium]
MNNFSYNNISTNKYKTIFLIFVLCSLFFSCNKNNETNNEIFFANKKAQRIKNPKKIISISPQITELIFLLESEDKLIGRTDFCTYPDEAKNIKSIGGINNANLEYIISLKPDLVITSSIFTKKMFQTLDDASIAVISFKEPSTFDGMFMVLEKLGKILNKEKQAKKIIDDSKREITDIIFNSKNKIIPTVYYVVGFGQAGDFSGGKDTFIDQIITLSGGDNIAKKSPSWAFSKEELFSKQPSYIFIRREDSARFVNTYPYTELKATKQRKVFGIESHLIDILTPKSIDAIKYIHNIINPKDN